MTPNRTLDQQDKHNRASAPEHSPSWWAHLLSLISSPATDNSPITRSIDDESLLNTIEMNRSLLMVSPLSLNRNPFSPASGAMQRNGYTSMLSSPLLSRLVQSVTSPEVNISNDTLANWSPFIGGGKDTEVNQYDIDMQPLTAESLSFSATNDRFNKAMEAAECHFMQANEKTASGDNDSELSYTESEITSEQSRSDSASHNSDDESGIFVELAHEYKGKVQRDSLSTTSNESSDSDNDKENLNRKSGRKISAPRNYSPDCFRKNHAGRKRKPMADHAEKDTAHKFARFRP